MTAMDTYVSELAESKLPEGCDDLPTDFVGDVQLHHAHFRRAERRVLFGSHGDAAQAPGTRLEGCVGALSRAREACELALSSRSRFL